MMNFKYILTLVVLTIFILGQYLPQTDLFEIGYGLRWFSYYLIPVVLLLFLATNNATLSLKKFSFFFLPAALIIIGLQSPNGDLWNPLDPGMTTMGIWLGTFYLIAGSLILFFKK